MITAMVAFFVALFVFALALWLSSFVAAIAKILWIFIIVLVVFSLFLLIRMIQEIRRK